ncbi:SUMF1/EgtB/PvdO family nonheme iron enzyme [Treponema sp. C6A8]|uniref:SUMF1/EgtB/PvdO family nonheme iron enzyme n=1 Tax=Treponema sp. C6A8 TaxID=1410609 RepID=UPI000485BAFF|nr:SUMF1/EgtB/PvdO family nonheme iron enzyme [Treponema sp. C6A8]
MKKKYTGKNIIISLLIWLGVFLAVSCDLMNNPVKGFFDEFGAFRISSDIDEFDNIDLTTSFVYYVSANGDDTNDGSKEAPFKTMDQAFTALKAAFVEEQTLAGDDSEKTNGYVLLLDSIALTDEVNLETYNFASLTKDVDIVIGGYGARRTINANYNCRVMSIGNTKGNVRLKNLTLTGGSTDDAGGAGLYVTSSDCGSNTCVIENCSIYNNLSSLSGAGIYLYTDYKVFIRNSEIIGNTVSDGAAACEIKYRSDTSWLHISNTAIKENNSIASTSPAPSSYDYGYVINTDGNAYVLLEGGVVIRDNNISQVSPTPATAYSSLCAVKCNIGIRLSGANIIRENSVDFTDGTVLTRNIVLTPAGSMATPLITLTGNCNGSSIGVGLNSSITADTRFTMFYSTYGTTAAPGSIFVSDCEYGIGYNSTETEAAFVLSSGGMGSPLDYTVNFTVFPPVIPTGKASSITVTPKVMKGTEDVSSTVTGMTFTLKLMDSSTVAASSSTNTLSVSAARALPGTYSLSVTAEWNGIAYDDTVSIVCRDALEGMISVSGASISGAIADSGVFVTGRNLTIPSLYVGQHELTQKEYQEYCYYAHSGKQPAAAYTGDNYPACFVSWYDAIVYCNLRSIAEGLTPAYSLGGETDPRKWSGIVSGSGTNAGKYCGPLANTDSWNSITFNTSANGWRMPVEAEWEYLARGANPDSASQTAYAGSDDYQDVAWTSDNASAPQLVEQKTSNSLGLYDMSGNVFEYVWDWYGGNISSSVGITGCDTPVEVTEAGYSPYRRIVRGGGFTYASDYSKISDRRVYNTPEMRWWNCGVRIVRNAN